MTNAKQVDIDPILEQVAQQVEQTGWKLEWLEPLDSDEPKRLLIQVPNGRTTRPLILRNDRARLLSTLDLTQVTCIGSWEATLDRRSDSLEVRLSGAGSVPSANVMMRVPGAEQVSPTSQALATTFGEDDHLNEEDALDEDAVLRPINWRLPLASLNTSIEAELCASSDLSIAFSQRSWIRGNRSVSLKISGLGLQRHDDAQKALEEIGGAILFDLDLRYGLSFEFARYVPRTVRRRPLKRKSQVAPSYPKLKYASDALTLYRYARGAFGMPLLQYLAYYQVLEFFYPRYYRQEQLTRVKQQLLDPRFNVLDETDLARLLRIASTGGRGAMSERDQLRATLAASLDEASLSVFLDDDAARTEALSNRKVIKDVPVLDRKSRIDMLDQVADRVYGIRCRIVHAKSDGGDNLAPLLLPGSQESDSLDDDLHLLRFLAQKVLLASAVSLS